MMSPNPGRKPFVRRAPIARPPVIPRAQWVRIPFIVSPPMTPEQLERAKYYASKAGDRPVHGVGRIPRDEPPIRDPKRLAEIWALLTGEKKPEPPAPPPSEDPGSR